MRRLLPPGLAIAAAIALSGCDGNHKSGSAASGQTSTVCGTYSGKGCAPAVKRVDLALPSFSHSTEITNPLFPIGHGRSAVLLGHVDGKPFRTETTVLPGRQTVDWNGRRTSTRGYAHSGARPMRRTSAPAADHAARLGARVRASTRAQA